jgi:hypothetical protein
MLQRITSMKNYQILAFALLALSSCSVQTSNQAGQQADSTKSVADTAAIEKTLILYC